MRRGVVGCAALVMVLSLSTVGYTQGLPGFPGPQAPPTPVEAKPDCSPAGVKSMQSQLEQMELIEKSGPETIGLVCSSVEALQRFMEWKDDDPLPDAINDLAKQLLHQNLTPRMVKAMCRQAQGDTGRNVRTEIGQLKDKIQGCRGV